MEILKQELEQIIKEEINAVIEEGWFDRQRARVAGAGSAAKGVAQRGAAAARYAATGEAPPSATAPGASYSLGKKSKILDLYKNKYAKIWRAHAKRSLSLNKELHQDAKDLGLLRSPVFQELKQALKTMRIDLDEQIDMITSDFDNIIRELESGELTE